MNRSVPEPLGLDSKEVMARLANEGYNELPSAKPRSLWAIAWEVVREPMFLLLIGASAIYLVLGGSFSSNCARCCGLMPGIGTCSCSCR
jgi:magnesium-transporting ATPase (P-type)